MTALDQICAHLVPSRRWRRGRGLTVRTCGSDVVERSHKEAPVDDDSRDDEPRPRGALLLILIYLVILTAFWLNTYLRIWRS